MLRFQSEVLYLINDVALNSSFHWKCWKPNGMLPSNKRLILREAQPQSIWPENAPPTTWRQLPYTNDISDSVATWLNPWNANIGHKPRFPLRRNMVHFKHSCVYTRSSFFVTKAGSRFYAEHFVQTKHKNIITNVYMQLVLFCNKYCSMQMHC